MSPAGVFYRCITSLVLWMLLFGRRFDDRGHYSIWSILVAMTIVAVSTLVARLVFAP